MGKCLPFPKSECSPQHWRLETSPWTPLQTGSDGSPVIYSGAQAIPRYDMLQMVLEQMSVQLLRLDQ